MCVCNTKNTFPLLSEHLISNLFCLSSLGYEAMIDVKGAALDLPYNSFDWSLLTTGWLTVILFGYTIRHVKGQKSDSTRAHLLLVGHLICALLVFAWRIGQNPFNLPLILFERVFSGSLTRSFLAILFGE